MKLVNIALIALVPMLSFCTPEPQKPTGSKKSPADTTPIRDGDGGSNFPNDNDSTRDNFGDPDSNLGGGSNTDSDSFLDKNSLDSLWDGKTNKDTTGRLTIISS